MLATAINDVERVIAIAQFYYREGFSESCIRFCDEKKKLDPSVVFWKCVALLSSSSSAALSEIQTLQSNPELKLQCIAATLYYHTQRKNTDKELLDKLSTNFNDQLKTASLRSIVETAQFYLSVSECDRARELARRVDLLSPGGTEAALIRAKADLETRKSALVEKAIVQFETTLESLENSLLETTKLQCKLGLVDSYTRLGKHQTAFDVCSNYASEHMWFYPFSILRMRCAVVLKDWECCHSVAQQLLSKDHSNIHALMFDVLYELTQNGGTHVGIEKLRELSKEIQVVESTNSNLFLRIAQFVVRLDNTNLELIEEAKKIINFALSFKTQSSLLLNEKAYQFELIGEYKNAKTTYTESLKANPGNFDALVGLARVSLFLGEMSEVESQYLFLSESNPKIASTNPQLLFINGNLRWLSRKDRFESANIFVAAIENSFRECSENVIDFDYFIKLNPSFILSLAKELIAHYDEAFSETCLSIPSFLELTKSSLGRLSTIVPGNKNILLYTAQIRFLAHEYDGASKLLMRCLKIDPNCSEAYLLLAKIELRNSLFKKANESLNSALSCDLKYSENAHFAFAMAKVKFLLNEFNESISILQSALESRFVKRMINFLMWKKKRKENPNFPSSKVFTSQTFFVVNENENEFVFSVDFEHKDKQHERQFGQMSEISQRFIQSPNYFVIASLFCALSDSLSEIGKQKYATEVFKTAKEIFADTEQLDQLRIAESIFKVRSGKADEAVQLLSSVNSNFSKASKNYNLYYPKAQMELGNIYLIHKKNSGKYVKVFQQLSESFANTDFDLLYANALMRTQQFAESLSIYDKVYKENPNNGGVIVKKGNALIMNHLYTKALDFYSSVFADNFGKSKECHFSSHDVIELCYEYAKLLVHFDKTEQAQSLIDEFFLMKKDSMTVDEMEMIVKFYILSGQLNVNVKNYPKAIEEFTKAKDMQKRVVHEQRDAPIAIAMLSRQSVSHILTLSGSAQLASGNIVSAKECLSDALEYNKANINALELLLKVFILLNETDNAKAYASDLLQIDEENESASLVLIEILLQQNEVETALVRFENFFKKYPRNIEVFAKFVRLLRTYGFANEAKRSFQKMKHSKLYTQFYEANGHFHYCKGMFHKLTTNNEKALAEFNKSKNDSKFGKQSKIEMLKLYTGFNSDPFAIDESKVPSTYVNSVKEIIVDLSSQSSEEQLKFFSQQVLLMTKSKPTIEKAITSLLLISENSKDTSDVIPSVLLNLGIAYISLKQIPKALSFLKQVEALPYSEEIEDEYERCRELIAQIYIQEDKFEQAKECLDVVLLKNRSNVNAWELYGQIEEKEQRYSEAAERYRKAWELTDRKNPKIGFKLAYNYLKIKRVVQSIDVCNRVLKVYPNYPRIQNEILEKARVGIKS